MLVLLSSTLGGGLTVAFCTLLAGLAHAAARPVPIAPSERDAPLTPVPVVHSPRLTFAETQERRRRDIGRARRAHAVSARRTVIGTQSVR